MPSKVFSFLLFTLLSVFAATPTRAAKRCDADRPLRPCQAAEYFDRDGTRRIAPQEDSCAVIHWAVSWPSDSTNRYETYAQIVPRGGEKLQILSPETARLDIRACWVVAEVDEQSTPNEPAPTSEQTPPLEIPCQRSGWLRRMFGASRAAGTLFIDRHHGAMSFMKQPLQIVPHPGERELGISRELAVTFRADTGEYQVIENRGTENRARLRKLTGTCASPSPSPRPADSPSTRTDAAAKP